MHFSKEEIRMVLPRKSTGIPLRPRTTLECEDLPTVKVWDLGATENEERSAVADFRQ